MQHYEISLIVNGSDSVEEVGLDRNLPTYPDKLYWGLLKFDKNGLYFRYPDMAKVEAMNQLAQDYRDMLESFVIPSMNGHERSFLKKKEPKDKKKAEKEDAAFWAAFKGWNETD